MNVPDIMLKKLSNCLIEQESVFILFVSFRIKAEQKKSIHYIKFEEKMR